MARRPKRANGKTPDVTIPVNWGLTSAEERTLEGLLAGLGPSKIAVAQRLFTLRNLEGQTIRWPICSALPTARRAAAGAQICSMAVY
jgi:hypothetical protein